MNRSTLLDKIKRIKKRGLLNPIDFPTGLHSMKKDELLQVYERLFEKEVRKKERLRLHEKAREHREKINEVFGGEEVEGKLENDEDWDALYGLFQSVPHLFAQMRMLYRDLNMCKAHFHRWLEMQEAVGTTLPNGEEVRIADVTSAFQLFQRDFERLPAPYFSFDIVQRSQVIRVLERLGYRVEKLDQE